MLLGLSYFKGVWIGNVIEKYMELGICCYRDFNYFSLFENNSCLNKWCILFKRINRCYYIWSVYGIKGIKFLFGKIDYFKDCYFKVILNGWKYDCLDELNRVKLSD